METIVFVTNNPHKLKEVKDLMPAHFELLGLKELGFAGDIPEEQATIEENALKKARYIYHRYHVNVFADDTGLEVEALNGKPGVHSARYAGPYADDHANLSKLRHEMAGITNRNARFKTVLALILHDAEYLFYGITEGTIAEAPAGTEGFGYDPVFKPIGYEHTYAEMPLEEKNKISHRGKAVRSLMEFLEGS